MEHNQTRNTLSRWKNNRKRKNTTKNSFCDDECKIIIEYKERAYNKMINRNTRQNEQEYKSERKEAIKIFRQKEEYCINQIWSKWKLLILLTVKQRNFIKK